MNLPNATRRDLLKAAGIGVAGLAGLSATTTPAASHPSVEASATDLLGPIQVPADSDAGFNYPYYLYVPESSQAEPAPMLVGPNNTGTATDDFEEHRTSARQFIGGTLGWTRTYSEALTVPLLVPVFPRPRSDPVDGTHYVHALDETTMNLDGGDLHRVDLQLLNMIDHAQSLLEALSYPVADDVMLNGFSPSGNFVNRFTALHPERVASVTAGGVNGTLLLPIEADKGHTLNYHIGVADLEAITGQPFDIENWREVPQFVYLGGEDENDTIPYDDAWNDTQRQIALDVYGEDMQDDRMPYCEGVYEDAGADARFEIYPGVGHRIPKPIQEDIVAFHNERAELKRVSFRGLPTAGDASIDVDVDVFDSRPEFDLRVRSDRRGDMTDAPVTVPSGEATDATVSLSGPVEDGETISVLVVPTGTTDPSGAVASTSKRARAVPSARVTNRPTAADASVAVEYALDPEYESSAPIHVYLTLVGSNAKQFVDTVQPGAGTATYVPDQTELGGAVESGTEFEVQFVDIDTDETLAADTVVVREAGQQGDAPATARFDGQPTAGRDRIAVEYTVDESYEPDTALTLQLGIGPDSSVLLDALEPGDAGTESFSVERIPLTAGSEIEVGVVDGTTLGGQRTVIVGDTDDAVDLALTGPPTAEEPSMTVEYRIDDSYEIQDALTLRSYTDGLPGSVPGDTFELLSPGDSDTATVAVSEDVAAGEGSATVAIVDDVPLALVSSRDSVDDGPDSTDAPDETDETETPTEPEETETPTPTEAGETETPVETGQTVMTGESNTADGTETAGADGPGFGIGAAVGGAAGASYFLSRRLDGSEADDEE